MNYYFKVLQNYATFSGRARRSEFWYFFLFNVIIAFVLAFVDRLMGTTLLTNIYALAVLIPSIAVGVRRIHDVGMSGWYFFLFNVIIAFVVAFVDRLTGTSVLTNIYALAVLIPSLAVGVRRRHDVGMSGWFLLVPIYNLILACTDGTQGDNMYGANPKV